MTDDALCVLLIGATGVFGRRLAEGIAREPDVNLILAGRTLRPLQALHRRLPRSTSICQLNREKVSAAVLRGIGADVVIDAAGPFQGSGSTLIEAAIDAGIHYIDLADGREFVANVRRYGAAAQRAGVAVITGASSTPALSHAVLDRMTRDWRRIDTLRVAISPGGRAPRGKSVARAILSWTGQQVRVFREGGWTLAPGWGPAREIEFPGVGKRLVSLCETPDLDLLADRYQPRVAAEFLAGVESRLLHHMLILAGLVVRRGWLSSLATLAVPGRWLAGMVAPFGTDLGGMVVEASGRNSGDRAVLARWSLAAPAGRGPYVPTVPAVALVRQIRDGKLTFRGAGPCTGLLELEDFRRDFDRMEILTAFEIRRPATPLFERALGRRFTRLPPVTQAIHQPGPSLILEGTADVDGAVSHLGRKIARLMGFPASAHAIPLRVIIEAAPDGSENWSRIYPDQIMRSVMSCPDAATGRVEERFGSLRFRLRLDTDETGLKMALVSARWRALPLPRWLLPRISASERAESDHHLFDVCIGLPVIGRLAHYRGSLKISDQYPSSSSGKALNWAGGSTGEAECR